VIASGLFPNGASFPSSISASALTPNGFKIAPITVPATVFKPFPMP
jgi:hypothetical protein